MEIVSQKRPRGDNLRPAISIPYTVWSQFKIIYSDKNIRDSIISDLLCEHLKVKDN